MLRSLSHVRKVSKYTFFVLQCQFCFYFTLEVKGISFFLTHILPWWNFLTKFCCQRRFLTKWIYLVFFLQKSQIWSKNLKISFRQFKLTLAKAGYRYLKKKKNPKRLGNNKNVNVALFCVVVQSNTYLWHWKMYFTLNFKFCLDYPIETKQEKY